jgi:hypothetical protein
MLKDKALAVAKVNSIIWNTTAPYESAGWPPGMLEHVKSIMSHLALDIIDSIYTEDELDSRINDMLLERP